MNTIDKDYFEQIELEGIASVLESKFRLKKGISCKNVCEIEALEYNYEALAIINFYYKHNIVEGKTLFYQASLCRECLIEHYDKYEKVISVENVTTYSYPTLYHGILSGNKEHMLKRAKLFGKYSYLEQNEFLANKLLGYALKYVILNDVENANKWLDELQKVKDKRGMKQLATGQGRAMRGLINHDEKEFNAGILTMLKNHVGRMKKEGDFLLQFFAYDSVALVMLAKDREINVTVKHELLPDEYFLETNMDYDTITML